MKKYSEQSIKKYITASFYISMLSILLSNCILAYKCDNILFVLLNFALNISIYIFAKEQGYFQGVIFSTECVINEINDYIEKGEIIKSEKDE